jgi:hypothetical protein
MLRSAHAAMAIAAMASTPSPAEHLSAENLAREALQRIAEMNPRESASYLLPAWRKAKGIARAAIVAMDAARSPAPEQPKAGEREEVGEAVEQARMLLDQGGISCVSQWPEVDSVIRTVLSALAEARSEVEEAHRRCKELQVEHDGLRRSERGWRINQVAAESLNATLAAQLEEAKAALIRSREVFRRYAQLHLAKTPPDYTMGQAALDMVTDMDATLASLTAKQVSEGEGA